MPALAFGRVPTEYFVLVLDVCMFSSEGVPCICCYRTVARGLAIFLRSCAVIVLSQVSFKQRQLAIEARLTWDLVLYLLALEIQLAWHYAPVFALWSTLIKKTGRAFVYFYQIQYMNFIIVLYPQVVTKKA